MICDCGFKFAELSEFRNCNAFTIKYGKSGIICPDCDKTYVGGVEVVLIQENDEEIRKMNESKYTPGPWRIWEHSSKYDPSCKIAQAAGSNFIAQTCGGNDEANACLIATAPELLEACKKILKETRGLAPFPDYLHPVTIRQLKDVVAEAEKGE